MKSIVTFSLLILVSTMVFGGMTNSIYAQDDPAILLKLAKRAQIQIQNQISSDSPDKIKKLFDEGIHEVNALEKAIKNDDIDSAKTHFLLAMKIFTEISRYSPESDIATKTTSESARQNTNDPSNDIKRLQVYVNSLKTIAKKYNASIDFTQLDELFSISRQQISNKEFVKASETLQEIKENIVEINNELREKASKQESQRAKEYAQQYLEQLDRLIENAKKQGLSDEIIEKLETIKENLSSADDPSEIVKQIRKIISIKDQFELTKNDRLESRVLQFEKIILRLSHIDGIDQDALADAKNTLNSIKRSLSKGEIGVANDLLKNLANQLKEIKNSL